MFAAEVTDAYSRMCYIVHVKVHFISVHLFVYYISVIGLCTCQYVLPRATLSVVEDVIN